MYVKGSRLIDKGECVGVEDPRSVSLYRRLSAANWVKVKKCPFCNSYSYGCWTTSIYSLCSKPEGIVRRVRTTGCEMMVYKLFPKSRFLGPRYFIGPN